MRVSFLDARALAILLSSLLLFLIQPIVAKAMLPAYGGSASVWTTSMLFFQATLLMGYGYSHLLASRLRPMSQAGMHALLLALSLLSLPVHLWTPEVAAGPSVSVLAALAVSVGLPFFVLSATSPLLQAWISKAQGELPKRLFALSNLASLTALLLYPFVIEPRFTLRQQLAIWSAIYASWIALMLAVAWQSRRHETVAPKFANAPTSDWIVWGGLAATASALWLAVANHLSQDVAAIPFFWVLPLAIYLLSFVLTFDSDAWYRPVIYRWLMPVAFAGIAVGFALRNTGRSLILQVAIFGVSLFLCCVFCHGEIVRRRPAAAQLTAFYLAIATGGATGALFVGVVAPLIFKEFLELPVALIVCMVFALGMLYGASRARMLRLGATAMIAGFVALYTDAANRGDIYRDRNFYGTLRIRQDAKKREMYNGTTQHGLEWLDPKRRLEPTTYYGPESGAALAFAALPKVPKTIAVIGLGTGTLAIYGRHGDRMVFYEINPAVIETAARYFDYVTASLPTVEVIRGDARLSLQKENRRFDMLMVDAFSGDAIPTHLLTREAVQLYLEHLAANGVLAFHVTNRYLNLAPVVRALADDAGLGWRIIDNLADPERAINFSTWALCTRDAEILQRLAPRASVPTRKSDGRLWTDDFSNLLETIR